MRLLNPCVEVSLHLRLYDAPPECQWYITVSDGESAQDLREVSTYHEPSVDREHLHKVLERALVTFSIALQQLQEPFPADPEFALAIATDRLLDAYGFSAQNVDRTVEDRPRRR